jgi:hypothetical protein
LSLPLAATIASGRLSHAEAIAERRGWHGLATTVVIDPGAGHRTVLPGEIAAPGGIRILRGGNDAADRRIGNEAWRHLAALLRRTHLPPSVRTWSAELTHRSGLRQHAFARAYIGLAGHGRGRASTWRSWPAQCS